MISMAMPESTSNIQQRIFSGERISATLEISSASFSAGAIFSICLAEGEVDVHPAEGQGGEAISNMNSS
jgi:hypothetical protein